MKTDEQFSDAPIPTVSIPTSSQTAPDFLIAESLESSQTVSPGTRTRERYTVVKKVPKKKRQLRLEIGFHYAFINSQHLTAG